MKYFNILYMWKTGELLNWAYFVIDLSFQNVLYKPPSPPTKNAVDTRQLRGIVANTEKHLYPERHAFIRKGFMSR